MDDYFSDTDTDGDASEDETLCESCYRFSCGVFQEGYNVCEKCGHIKENQNIDQTGEWNNYTKTDGAARTDNSRCGFTDSDVFKTSELSTTVRGNSRIAQMCKWGSVTHQDADAYYMKETYSTIAETVGFNYGVVAKACKIYRDITDTNIVRQNVRDGIKAAALFQALAAEPNYSYTISDVAKWFGITAQSASAGNATITSFLFRESKTSDVPSQAVQITKASDIVERFANMFQLEYSLRMETIRFCESVQKRNEFYGTHGSSLAAGVIYYFIKDRLRLGDEYNIKKVSERTDVSSGTIKKIYNSLQKLVAAKKKKQAKTN